MPLDAVSTWEVTDAIAETLRDVYRNERHAPKRLAEEAGSSVRAAENWLERRNAMSLSQFITLARRMPEMRALACQLIGIETAVNPEFEANLRTLMTTAAEKGWLGHLSERAASGNAD